MELKELFYIRSNRFMGKFFLIVSLFYICSCAKTSDCETGGLNISFVDLLEDEPDTLQVESYKKGTNFSELVQKKTYVFEPSLDSINGIVDGRINLSGNPTSFHSSETNNSGFLSASYDYRLVLNGEEFRISDMLTRRKTKKCGGIFSLECPTCFNPVVYFKQDNAPYHVSPNDLHVVNE